MGPLRIQVVKIGGYLKAILLNGQETVFGRDERELLGRLKFCSAKLGVDAREIEKALVFRRKGA